MTRRILILLGLVLLAGVIRWQTAVVDMVPAASLGTLPYQFGSWAGRPGADYTPPVLAMLGVDDYVNRAYTAEDTRQANLYVGYYRSQDQGASIHSPLNCLPGAGWAPERVERVPFASGTARRVVIRKGSLRLMVLYWYQTPTRIEGDEYLGRLYAVIDAMRYGRNDAAMVRVTVAIEGADPNGESNAYDRALELARLVYPSVDRALFPNRPERLARAN